MSQPPAADEAKSCNDCYEKAPSDHFLSRWPLQ